MRHKAPSKRSKYYMPKELFLTVVHYCKQYPEWITELASLRDTRRAVTYDTDKVQTSGGYDSTSESAIRIMAILEKKELIDDMALAIAGDLNNWLIMGVCYDMPFTALQHKGIPCGKDLYYSMRRRFYYELAKRI